MTDEEKFEAFQQEQRERDKVRQHSIKLFNEYMALHSASYKEFAQLSDKLREMQKKKRSTDPADLLCTYLLMAHHFKMMVPLLAIAVENAEIFKNALMYGDAILDQLEELQQQLLK